jgi:hypothetical protein
MRGFLDVSELGRHQGGLAADKEERGKRKEERDYYVADISHSTFHIPLSTKFVYLGNHNS